MLKRFPVGGNEACNAKIVQRRFVFSLILPPAMETRPRIQNRQRSGRDDNVDIVLPTQNCVYMICASRSLPVCGSAVPKTANVNSRLAAVGASACPRPKMRPAGRSLLISSELSLIPTQTPPGGSYAGGIIVKGVSTNCIFNEDFRNVFKSAIGAIVYKLR